MPFDMEQEEYEEELREKELNMHYQGKTKEQVQFSEFMAGMSILFLICGVLFGIIIKIIL